MANDDSILVGVKVSSAEINEKLDILRLERGISSHSFIISAIVEKLMREGYLPDGVQKHQPVNRKPKPSDVDELIEAWRKIGMRR